MTRLLIALMIVLVASPEYGLADPVGAQTSEQLGLGDGLNCENFRSVAEGGGTDLDRFFAEFPDDPYDLDRGESPIPCEDRAELGTGSRANCLSFRPANDGGQAHAQALYDAAGPGDPYGLHANGDGRACLIEAAQDEPLPSAPAPSAPSTAGCIIFAEVAHASACAGGPVSVESGLDDDVVPVAASDAIATGAQFPTGQSTEQRTAEQTSRTVDGEQQAKRKAKKRKVRKAKRLKQRQLEREHLRQHAADRD